MMKILTAEQMRQVDRLSTERFGIPSILLMENASVQLFRALEERFPDLDRRRIGILAGKGNNGGDGAGLARQLMQRRISPAFVLLAKSTDVTGDARINLDILLKSGLPVMEVRTPSDWVQVRPVLDQCDIVVDAILGTGLSKTPEGLYREAIEWINQSSAFVLAVDIPSGMPSDSCEGNNLCVRADLTVTFTAPKIAHVLNGDQEALGRVSVVPIGSPPQLLDDPAFSVGQIDAEMARQSLPSRRVNAHKGDFGHVALVGGSPGKAGAITLSAAAALRTGSGLVTVHVPSTVQQVVASARPEIMTAGLATTAEGTFALAGLPELIDDLRARDAVGVGPGISRVSETAQFVRRLVHDCPVPMVLDADGLNAFEGAAPSLRIASGQALVLTPHPGEFARLTGLPPTRIAADPIGCARAFATEHQLWVVLKGFRTLLASPDGQVLVCPRGNPGMATAGMGDTLTGILTSLVGQYAAAGRTTPQDMTRSLALGVFVHATAGDRAALVSGYESLVAGDVIEHLGIAFEEIRHGTAQGRIG